MKTKFIALLIGIIIAISAFSVSFAVPENACSKDYFKSENTLELDATDRIKSCLNDSVMIDVYRTKVLSVEKISIEEPAPASCEQTIAKWKKSIETESVFCEKDKMWYNVSYKIVVTKESTRGYAMLLIFAAAVIVSALLTIINKLLVNQERVKEIQKYVSDYNKKLMKATREKNQEEIKALEGEKQKVMQMQSEMMRMQMPVFASMIPFFAVFILLGNMSGSSMWGEFLKLPFTIPIFGLANGKLGWLGWYILCSLPMTSVFRRALKVN